ncbi:MAG: signal peptidase I [Clostridia bacterium]|nr:signal peptidase I [Clostridia bacterium]
MNTAPNSGFKDSETKALPAGLKAAREIYEWLEIFVITIAAILLVFTFVARIAYVDGPSMNNTLYDGERLCVSNLFYTPKQGDIVVFQSPDSGIEGGIVKRVIATEGQEVDIDFETWTVYVDGTALDEPYVNYLEGYYMRSYDVEFPLTVPEGQVFVMGDNRNYSNDSRASQIGCVDTRFIFGRVLFRITPLSRFGTVD